MQSMNGRGEKSHYISVTSRVYKVHCNYEILIVRTMKINKCIQYVGYTNTAYSQTQESNFRCTISSTVS